MHIHPRRQFGLWHIGIWLTAAGFAVPTLPAAAANADTAATAASSALAPAASAATDEADTPILASDAGAGSPPDSAPASTAGAARVATVLADELASAWQRVDDAALDTMRGGFTNGNGLMVSLGIDRLVSINGDVVAHSRIDIDDLGHISSEQARQTSAALSSVKLVQNGSENIYRAGDMGAALGGLVIQNSLNNQLIRTETVIGASVNSAGLLNTLNFHGTLQDALTRATGQP